jgi:sec-independent protein translocase protein TatA
MPSWIGPWEIVIVVVVALLIFGPKKLPEFGSSLGKSLSGFKRGLREGKEELQAAMKEDTAEESAVVTEKTDEG